MKLLPMALTIMLGAQASSPAFSQSVVDEWWTPGFNARVKLAQCDDKLCGTIVWAWDDTPSGAADKRPLVGQRIVKGMRLGENSRYTGSIYNPEDGRSYNASLYLKTANTLQVEGCVLFFCQTQIWRRHDSLRSPPVSVVP